MTALRAWKAGLWWGGLRRRAGGRRGWREEGWREEGLEQAVAAEVQSYLHGSGPSSL